MRDLLAGVVDQPTTTQRANGERDRGATNPQRERQEFLSQRQVVLPHAIVKRKEPPGEPFFDRMQGVAGDGLSRETMYPWA